MEAYTAFAGVYDEFMDNIPYEEWCGYLAGLLHEYGIKDGLVAELGCGTGAVTRRLDSLGYDMIGIDNSEDMLSIAREKSEDSILYLLQDMRELELYGTVRAVVSLCDSMNYILDGEELYQVFCLVNNYLDKDGIFIFDLNTEYKYKELLGDAVIAENREGASFIWENCYDEGERVNEYILTLFIREEGERYRKFVETHYQRAYSLEEIRELLRRAGLVFVAAYDAFTRETPRKDSERIYVVAREGHQEKKRYV